MRRRRFLRTALATAAASASAPFATPARAARLEAERFDLIVIGAGTAGIPAAIFAARRGARVLLLDAAGDIGGTLHLSDGEISAAGTRLQAARGIVGDSPDRHFDDVMRISNGLADPRVIRRVVDEAPATINWLLDAGLEPLPEHPIRGHVGREMYSMPRYLWARERGRAILAILRRELAAEVARGRVVTQLEARVGALIVGAGGAIDGVRTHVAGVPAEYCGRSVLLTSGGYAMNPELFERLNGQPAYVAGSYPHSQGDGLSLAASAGGYLRGRELYRSGSGSILTSDHFPAKVYARFNTMPQQRPPWEIWVDAAGRRFVREDEPSLFERERAVSRVPRLRYAIVFDKAILETAPPGIADWPRDRLLAHFGTHPMFATADSLESLAGLAGLDAAGLVATVRDYNASVARQGGDGLGRSHLPRPIGQPPYYAITQLGHSATSSTGVAVDGDLRVLRGGGEPIPNLYAAGEVLGSGATLGNSFVPGMMLTPALSLGRWLGMRLGSA